MAERYKSGRSLAEEHRHDNYRKFNRMIHLIRNYKEHTDSMNVLFKSKYTQEEVDQELAAYEGDDPVEHLQSLKDSQFRDLIAEVSLAECRQAHSCVVVRSHNYFNGKEATYYKWLYHSLEEYLVEIYNRGDDFILYLSYLGDLFLRREDEFEYLAPITPTGEMLIRAMKHDPLRRLPYRQEFYMLYTVLSKRDVCERSRMFILRDYKEGSVQPPYNLRRMARGNYTRYRKYKGEE